MLDGLLRCHIGTFGREKLLLACMCAHERYWNEGKDKKQNLQEVIRDSVLGETFTAQDCVTFGEGDAR